jgi:hypothetical protein
MTIPWQSRVAFRRTAPYHVQLELERGTGPLSLPTRVNVQGHVVRAFRTDGRLGPGDPVAFRLWVCQAGDEPEGPAYIHFEPFSKARYMEAYLSGNPPDCRLAGYELAVIDAPSEQPSMSAEQLEEWIDLIRTGAQSILKKKPWWKGVLERAWTRMCNRGLSKLLSQNRDCTL